MFVLLSDMANNMWIATAIFLVASITDFVDGYLARSRNMVTDLGKFMDPLADKLLITSALLCFVQLGLLSSWVVMVILAREFIVSIFRAVAANKGIVIAASIWGKLKTNSQMIMVILILLGNYPFSMWNIPMDQVFVWLATGLTLVSGYDYIAKNLDVLKES